MKTKLKPTKKSFKKQVTVIKTPKDIATELRDSYCEMSGSNQGPPAMYWTAVQFNAFLIKQNDFSAEEAHKFIRNMTREGLQAGETTHFLYEKIQNPNYPDAPDPAPEPVPEPDGALLQSQTLLNPFNMD